MNKLATLSLLAAGALAFTPQSAVAGDKTVAAIGGFIGGLIVGSQVNSHSSHTTVIYDDHCPPPGPVVIVSNGPGYWIERPVQVWVAPTWIITYDPWNRPIRRYVAGHHTTRMEKVWVNHTRPTRHIARHDDRRPGRNDRYDRRDRRDHRW